MSSESGPFPQRSLGRELNTYVMATEGADSFIFKDVYEQLQDREPPSAAPFPSHYGRGEDMRSKEKCARA